MLRDFVTNPSKNYLVEVLNDFGVDQSHLRVLRFEVISPDSFMWRLEMDSAIYYLFAEDYIPGLEYVRGVFNQYLQSSNWSFVRPATQRTFEESSPVKTATVYTPPNANDEFSIFATDSGHDLVFLCKSQEDYKDSLTSDVAPRGFNAGTNIHSN